MGFELATLALEVVIEMHLHGPNLLVGFLAAVQAHEVFLSVRLAMLVAASLRSLDQVVEHKRTDLRYVDVVLLIRRRFLSLEALSLGLVLSGYFDKFLIIHFVKTTMAGRARNANCLRSKAEAAAIAAMAAAAAACVLCAACRWRNSFTS